MVVAYVITAEFILEFINEVIKPAQPLLVAATSHIVGVSLIADRRNVNVPSCHRQTRFHPSLHQVIELGQHTGGGFSSRKRCTTSPIVITFCVTRCSVETIGSGGGLLQH